MMKRQKFRATARFEATQGRNPEKSKKRDVIALSE
jgi:hypothetical protein